MDDPALPFHDEVDEMTMAEYLRQARKDNVEWVADFRTRYGITERPDDHFTAEELYEARSHHDEYGHAHS